jgi:hypothetical protein
MAAGESAVNRASMAQAAQQVEAAYGVITGLQANMNGYSSQVIHDKLVSTRNTYQATEDANTARVNQVAGLIGGGATVSGAAAAKGGSVGLGGTAKGGGTAWTAAS